MSNEVSTHPSLCPPLHGHPPNNVPWVLLDLHAYVADRENSTSAYSEMSNGKAIRVTFCTAPPPLVSYICVWCPDLPPTELIMEPTIEAAEADLVLFRLSLSDYPNQRDYFVYKAGGGKRGPWLWRVEEPDLYMPYRYSSALLPRRDLEEGGSTSPHADEHGHFYIAALNLTANPSASFEFCLYDSMDKKWTTSTISLLMPMTHITAKVIALGGGVVAFVDPWRGILVCDLLHRGSERYLPLPRDLIRFGFRCDEILLHRDFAFSKGRLTLVEMHRSSDCQGWDISTWSISSPWEEQDSWRKECTVNTHSIIIDDDTANVELLPKLQDNGSTLRPSLDSLLLAYPVLSLSDNRVVYLMGMVDRWDKKALVLSVGTMDARLQGVVIFDAERMLGYTWIQSRISNFFSMHSRWRGKLKRPGKFQVCYPHKHHQTGFTMMHGVEFGPMQRHGGAKEQQDTGAEDGDNKMAVD
ncbi:hypothetical protein SEVIR_7G213300v4 [Setaria viridis]|uniref:DUF1618 domain-containing protein n=1 Tax=Setaria viridis TaxID=4556 RepID=A0A4V6D4D1_SETVI|nr:uncharacterized protein LOC117862724 [Setaria viridis]TKW05996.1 hypothetical protein SEVIR_7G213300v2 [Setaria viridis]